MRILAENILFYRQKLALARELLSVTEAIQRLIQQHDIEKGLARFKKRERVITHLKALDKESPERRFCLRRLRKEKGRAEETTLKSLLDDFRLVLKEVAKLDAVIRRHLLEEREKITAELKDVSANHKIAGRYAPQKKDVPRYFSISA